MALGDVYSVKIDWLCGAVRSQNVLHFAFDVGTSDNPAETARELANSFLVVFGTKFAAVVASNSTLVRVRVRRVNNSGGPTYSTAPVNIPGQRPSISRNPNMGPFLVAGFPNAGGWRKGFILIPAGATDDINGLAMNPDLMTALEELADALKTLVIHSTMGDAFYCVWSRVDLIQTRPLAIFPLGWFTDYKPRSIHDRIFGK